MIRDLGPFTPRRPHKLSGPLLAMLLNGVHDRHQGRVFVVQIGAGRGQSLATLHQRLTEEGWSGLLIEPHPENFEALETLYADSDSVAVLNLGISDVSANLTLHSLSDEGARNHPKRPRHRASLIRDRIVPSDAPDSDVQGIEVPFLRMDSVLRELGIATAQVVIINGGGHEDQILRSFDLSSLAPSLVLVQSRSASPADAACIATLEAASLVVFRIGEWLAGLPPRTLAVPLEELLTFFGRDIRQPEIEE